MPESTATAISQVLTIALIVFVVRWLLEVEGPTVPETHGESFFYRTKWQMRMAGLAVAGFFTVVLMLSLKEAEVRRDRLLFSLVFGVFILLGIWLASGVVTTNQTGITKKVLWISHSFRWDEITEVSYSEKRKEIHIRAADRKMTVDRRFIAGEQLLKQITERTGLRPKRL
jgi:hypothetical protein